MTKQRIKEIFEKHFNELGKYFDEKVLKNEKKFFNDFYRVPISISDLISGTIFNTCNIRYGDFLEEIINEFLIENSITMSLEDKKKGNYDLLFRVNDKLYVGEVKIRDNHDSTKKLGQISNLIKKASLQKERNPELNIITIFYFIDPTEKKNGKFYIKELKLCVEKKLFDDARVFYGDEIFNELNLIDKWNQLENDVTEFNKNLKEKNHIFKIIEEYLKTKYDEKRYNEIIEKLKR